MKKTITLVMLALLLFYQGGYILLFQYYIHRSDIVEDNRISNDKYKSSDLVEIKIPVKLSSVTNSDDYEPISGQVQLNGNYYNYVKLKVSQDTMYLMVIPNQEKTRLVNAKVNYGKLMSDLPQSKKSHVPLIKRALADNDYNLTGTLFNAKVSEITLKGTSYLASLNIPNPTIDVAGQPPEVINALS